MTIKTEKIDKRQVLLASAERLFRERRVHELTMDDVSRAAGVGKGTIYRYFKDKDDLLFHVATAGFDELCVLVEAAPPGGTFAERLLTVCSRISTFFRERWAVMRMIHEHEGRFGCFNANMRERWLAHRHKLVGAVAALLEQGREEGLIREDLPSDMLANLLLGMLRARGRSGTDGRQQLPLEMVIDVFLNGTLGR